MSSQSEPPAGLRWVDARRGLVSREIFVSDDVCKLEVERIFNRSWIFLGHETELPKPGDFVSRNMGNAPVVVVRQNPCVVEQLPSPRRQDLSRRRWKCAALRMPISRVDLRKVRSARNDHLRQTFSEWIRFFRIRSAPCSSPRSLQRNDLR